METVDRIVESRPFLDFGYRLDDNENAYLINPVLQAELQGSFVSRVGMICEELDWKTHLLPAANNLLSGGLPEIAVIPAHQQKRYWEYGYQLEAGIPAVIQLEDWSDITVRRTIGFHLIKFRLHLDALDSKMPNIISSEHIATFRNDEPVPCNPERWGDMAMKFTQELWARQMNNSEKRTLL